jgi:predicted glycoside hydrolase/deacetylase ChbG (UPF0249 family)
MLIVNADDFGYSAEVNDAILRAFREKLISSATLMANMPGFDDACRLAQKHELADRLGIHLNVTEGEPLTERIRTCATFSASGSALTFVRGSNVFLWPEEAAALREEVDAQLRRCLKMAIVPTHADSHHHFHTELPIFLPIVPVLKRQGIRFVRLTDNVRPGSLARRAYKRGYNFMLSALGLRGTHYFCDAEGLARCEDKLMRNDVVTEVMVHPVYGPGGELLDATCGLPLRDVVARAASRTKLCSYADLGHVRMSVAA